MLSVVLGSSELGMSMTAVYTWILVGRPLRNPVTAPRSSRHQSRNRPIFFARSRSSLVLKPLTVVSMNTVR